MRWLAGLILAAATVYPIHSSYKANGTGAVSRGLASKLSDTVSVMDFGAKGDGTTDDTAAIQAAITAGKTILFPGATYLVSGALSVPAQRILVGEGRSNTVIKNGVTDTTILKVANAGTATRTLEITIRGIYFQSNQAATSTILDLRGSSYLTLDDVQVIGNLAGVGFADASTATCIDMTLGSASFNGYNRFKNVYTSFCSIGAKIVSNVMNIEGGAYDLNSTRGLWVLGSQGVVITGSDISSNGKSQVTTFSVDRYDRGGLLIETTNGVFVSGVYHELNALRESATEFSPNDVEILATCTRARYFAARADISAAGPIYGQASTYGAEYGGGRGPQYGSEAGLIPNGEFRSLNAVPMPTFWNVTGTITASATSALPVGVTGQRFTPTTGFARLWYPIFSAADCTRYAGRTITLTFWAAPITNPWTSQFLRGGLTPTATGIESGSAFFVLTASGLATPQKYSARYKIIGNEPGVSVFFTIGTFTTAAIFEVGSVSASLSESEPYVPEQAIDSSGGRIWNTANIGTITLAAGTGTATVVSGGKCVCTDTTANASVKCSVATTTLTATGTAADVISYLCF